jgi:hypothetical protein
VKFKKNAIIERKFFPFLKEVAKISGSAIYTLIDSIS